MALPVAAATPRRYAKKMNCTTTVWNEPPSIAVPNAPCLLYDDDDRSLWLAYHTMDQPNAPYAIIRFDDVIDHRLSPINDEGLGSHPYAWAGLQFHSFNEVMNSAETEKWKVLHARHWVITFQDNTLDVVAGLMNVIPRVGDPGSAADAIYLASRAPNPETSPA